MISFPFNYNCDPFLLAFVTFTRIKVISLNTFYAFNKTQKRNANSGGLQCMFVCTEEEEEEEDV